MSQVLVTERHLSDIAGAIRAKSGGSDTYRPGEMAAAIRAMEGYPEPAGSVHISENGTHDVKDYAEAVVDVADGSAAFEALQAGIAIIVDGDRTTTAINAGQYAYIKNSVLSEGLYVASENVPTGTLITAQTAYFTVVSGGGLNAIQRSLADVYSTTAVKTPAKWLNGNHIFRRVYPIDTLPNNATIQIPHGITSQQSIIAISGLCYRKTARNQTRSLPFGTGDSNGIRIDTGPDAIFVITKADWTTYAGYVILEYVDN